MVREGGSINNNNNNNDNPFSMLIDSIRFDSVIHSFIYSSLDKKIKLTGGGAAAASSIGTSTLALASAMVSIFTVRGLIINN